MLNKSVSSCSPFLMILLRVSLVQVRKTWPVLGKQVEWLLLPLSSFAPLLCLYSCKYEGQSLLIFWSRWAVCVGIRQFVHICVFLSAHVKLSLFIVAKRGEKLSTQAVFCCCWILTEFQRLGCVKNTLYSNSLIKTLKRWVLLVWTKHYSTAQHVCSE